MLSVAHIFTLLLLIKALGLYQEKRYKYRSNIFQPKLAIVLLIINKAKGLAVF